MKTIEQLRDDVERTRKALLEARWDASEQAMLDYATASDELSLALTGLVKVDRPDAAEASE